MLMKQFSSSNEKLVRGSRLGTIFETWHSVDSASVESPTAAECFLLDLRQGPYSLLGQRQERIQFCIVEGRFFSCSLDLDESRRACHDDVHIDIRDDILRIIQIESRNAVDYSNANRGDAAAQRILFSWHVCKNGVDRIDERDESTRDGGSSGAAIGLENVAIDSQRSFTDLLQIRNRAK